MRFLLVDTKPRSLSVLQRLEKEGHDVLFLSPGAVEEDIVRSTTLPSEAEEWGPDVAIFNAHGAGSYAKHLEEVGVKVFGGGLLHDNLHKDPDYISILASRVRVPIFPLDNGGVKLKIAGFYSRKTFISPAFSYAEDYGLLGEEGNAEAFTIHALPRECHIIEETFVRLEKLFTAFQFSGMVFAEVQIDSETGIPHIHRLSIEVPEGFWPAFLTGLKQPLGEFFKGVASGKRFKVEYTEEVSGAIKVSVPPYPNVNFPWLSPGEQMQVRELVCRGARGIHIQDPGEDSIFWMNVQRNGTGKSYVTTGPEIAYVGAAGDFTELPYTLYAQVRSLNIPNVQYRQNVGTNLARSLAYFEDYGMLEETVPKGYSKFNDDYGSRFRTGHYRKEEKVVEKEVPPARDKVKKVRKKVKK